MEANLTRSDSSDEEPPRPVGQECRAKSQCGGQHGPEALLMLFHVLQDRSSNRFAILAPDPNHDDLSVSASNVGSQTIHAAILLDNLEDLTRAPTMIRTRVDPRLGVWCGFAIPSLCLKVDTWKS